MQDRRRACQGSATISVLVLIALALLIVIGARLFGDAVGEKYRCHGDAVMSIGEGAPECGEAALASVSQGLQGSGEGGETGSSDAPQTTPSADKEESGSSDRSLLQRVLDLVGLGGGEGGDDGGGGEPRPMPPPRDGHDDVSADVVDGTPFVRGEGDAHDVSHDDVRQGALGDCYFLSQLAAIARVRPDFIEQMIEDNGDGTYDVTLHVPDGNGWEETTVTVDDRFWVDDDGNPVYARPGDEGDDGVELWAMLIEKAWAQLTGSYDDIQGGGDHEWGGGAAVTGQRSDYVNIRNLDDEDLLDRLDEHFNQNGQPVSLWSRTDDPEGIAENGVVANHAYSVVSVDTENGTATLYNPWGFRHVEEVDMEFLRENYQTGVFYDVPAADGEED